MTTSSPINPYESPRESAGKQSEFSDGEVAELADLRRRVSELERRVGRSWVVHGNFFLRIFAVWGYWILGYGLMVAVVFAVMGLIWLATGRWP
jgi:hypothetical protein